MKDYSKMSDFEINKLIAVELAPDGYIGINESTRSDSEVVITTENGEGCTKNSYIDYCNNPSDAWPIIIDNSITFNYDTAQVHVGSYFSDTAKISENRNKALRAAMIVYLMVKGAE